jgi:hypothetical protein
VLQLLRVPGIFVPKHGGGKGTEAQDAPVLEKTATAVTAGAPYFTSTVNFFEAFRPLASDTVKV